MRYKTKEERVSKTNMKEVRKVKRGNDSTKRK